MKKVLMSFAAGVVLLGASATSASAEEYQIEEGDTLTSIGQEYNVSVDNLMSWNDLTSDLIIANETLDIKDGESSNENEANVEEETQTEEAPVEEEPQAEQEESDNQATAENESSEEEQPATPQEEENTEDQEASNNEEESDASGETMTMSATAYTADCNGCSGTTADGTELSGDENVIAVDPDKIPLGSEVHVEGYGDAIAADTGGAINGNKIDLHMGDEGEAQAWGNQEVEVTVK